MVVLAYAWKSFHIINLFVLKLCIHLPQSRLTRSKNKERSACISNVLLDTSQINAALCAGISF